MFIGSEKRGYFNYSRSNNIILVYAYTGDVDYFAAIGQQMLQHCADKGFEFNLFADQRLEAIGDTALSATPFGVIQRVLNIKQFALGGSKMRRLRYQVSKFEKVGQCKTVEYQCGSDQKTDQQIIRVIDQWCEARAMVNPLIEIVREEILSGTLDKQHRVFITSVDDVLQNAILISSTDAANSGYLMDLEFYPKDMPLGGLEYAIVQIIEVLAGEGCEMLSMGLTIGPKLADSPNADLAVDKVLDELREQNIFSDDGNLQFKNKFRPQNSAIYLCREVAVSNPDSVIDIIMMIADPAKVQTSDEENHIVGQAVVEPAIESMVEQIAVSKSAPALLGTAAQTLAEFGYNPLNVPHQQVEFDLKSDSWGQIHMPVINRQMKHLHSQLQQPADLQLSLRAIFPFNHFVVTSSGRAAENIFYQAWDKTAPKTTVLQNLLFPTAIFHQIDKGFTPVEVPHSSVFELQSDSKQKAHLDWQALQQKVQQAPETIAFVCLEVSDNAAGGYPVSMAHCQQVKDLLSKHDIKLVIDGTRVLENAQWVIENEVGYDDKTVWQVAATLLGFADAVICSLAKDFCINKGGVIATNDQALFERLQTLNDEAGSTLDAVDLKLLALSLQNKKHIQHQVLRRLSSVRQVHQAFIAKGLPIVQPSGSHCILFDVKQLPAFSQFAHPVASFVAWFFVNTGIRVGEHSVGMLKGTAINDLVRMAIPVGLKAEQIDQLLEKVVTLFDNMANIPELTLVSPVAGADANYSLVKYHNSLEIAGETACEKRAADKPVEEIVIPKQPVEPQVKNSQDIAIVGMAGRYPDAKNLDELWQNIKAGKDS
ncbi:MAG: DUF2156 domain-containing protein, partial [Algicola sp.]|nr:DUF2156 domain-containing protein [Algicola sp.]